MKIFTKSSKQLRDKLLTGASVAILSVVLTTAQVAMTNAGEADRFDGKMWASIQGGFNLYSGSSYNRNFASYNPTAYTVKTKPKSGWSGILEVGSYLHDDSLWAISLRAEYGRSKKFKTKFGAYAPSVYNDVKAHKEEYVIVDFEAQRDVGLGILGIPNTKAKARLGVRFAHLDAKTTINYGSYGGVKSHRKFTGAGPLVGLNTKTTVYSGEDTDVSLETSSAFALLIGKRKNTGSDTGGAGYSLHNERRSKTVVVPNLDLSAGINFGIPALNGSIGLGYRVNALFGIMDTGHLADCGQNGGFTDCSGPKSGNRIIHGPYVKLKINLN